MLLRHKLFQRKPPGLLKKSSRVMGLFLLLLSLTFPLFSQQLTHDMTEEEKALMPAYLESLRTRIKAGPPLAPVRNIAEFEHMEGVLIAYPLGIPVSLVATMSEHVMITTIVDNASSENQARSQYSSGGVNLDNCNFIYAPHDSYWTRDYGPWFVMDGNQNISIINFVYNRPRPNDNNIPVEMANFLGLDWFDMDLVHSGGNYMTDAWGISVSTDLVWEENTQYTHTQIEQIVYDYLGVHTYHVTIDPLGSYIKHVDCWGKYLDVDKVLIGKVPQVNPQYDEYESVVNYFASQTTGYGNYYQVYRVDTPNSEPYTNSLILNKRVFVPVMGSASDSGAIAAYTTAMPGYEVIGVSGDWVSTDALHCRVMGIADRGMLYIKHSPLLGEKPSQPDYEITAEIIPYSGMQVIAGSVKIYYKVNGGTYYTVNMNNTSADSYTGSIPGQAQGSEIAYYIHAEDMSGRISEHPYIGGPDPHVFTVSLPLQPPDAQFTANHTSIYAGDSVQFTDLSTNSPTSWSWSFPGGTPSSSTAQNPSVTYNTPGSYDVTLTVYNSVGDDTETKVDYINVQEAVLEYCDSSGNNQNYEYIAGVQVGNLNNSSGASGYSDFTAMTADLTAGASASVSLTPGFTSSSYTEYWRIWIDYNIDGDFDDTGELVFSGSGSSTVTGNFTVPSGAEGLTRMRVSMSYNSYPSPCGTFTYGEVEDYSVDISSGTPPPQYTLTTNTVGQGGVTLNPPGGTYDEGTVVTLTAVPAAGWQFDYWSGDLSGSQNPINITMNADKTVTANFSEVTVPQYTLTVNTVGQGSVTLNPAGGTYNEGTVVTLTAVPDSGWKFDNWSGDLSGTQNPDTITMDSNKTVIANFSETGSCTETVGYTTVFGSTSTSANRRALPFTMPENGTICSVTIYHAGGSGGLILGVYDGEGTPQNRIGITPTTTINSSAGWQTIDLSSPAYVAGGSTVWLAWVFQSNPGIRYQTGSPGRYQSSQNWSGGMPDPFGSGSQANYLYSIYANYAPSAPPQYTLTVNILGQGTVSLNPPGGTYDAGTVVTLTATPDSGWQFDGWSGDLSGSQNPAAVTMNNNKSVTAVFSEIGTTGTVGNTNVLTSTSTSNSRRAMPFTMPEDGTITSVTMYHSGGSGDMILGVYDGVSLPQNRLGVTSTTAVSGSTGWQTINLATPVFVQGGTTIWLAWVYEDNPGIRYQTGSPGRVDSGVGWSGGMPDPFGSGSQTNYIYSIYATYTID
jgi:agmatine deiminase